MIIEKIKYVLLLIFLVQIAKVDLKTRKIPNQSLKKLLFCRCVLFVTEETLFLWKCSVENLVFMISGFLYGGGILLVCYIVTKRKIGAGDVKLFALIGLYVGRERVLRIIVLSFAAAFVFCVVKMFFDKMNLKSPVPMGMFIFIGTLLEILFWKI